MRLITKRPHKSLPLGSIDGIELPALSIITGANGSGKSNLLEALSINAIISDELGELPLNAVRLFRLGELLAAAEGPVTAQAYKEPWANVYNNLQAWRESYAQMPPDQIDANLTSNLINGQLLTAQTMDRMRRDIGKPVRDWSLQDMRDHSPVVVGVRDPFAASIAEVFLSYAQRRAGNELAQWRFETKGRGDFLSDEEFFSRFGAPPWKLLDETLRVVGLPYTFDPPPEDIETATYEVALHSGEGVTIKPVDLSSGERVLMAVAMSLFTGAQMKEAIELPRLLLLDEADASLHPSMVKSLLTVVEEIFVKQYSVNVILTTHSPSTVALAPPSSLHVMSRSTPRLRKATTDEALRHLTVGISSLSVRMEDRHQVFVESEYDQGIYQDVFVAVRSYLATSRSAEFIAVGKRQVGGGADAVKRIVKELRSAGVITVHGVVDRDQRQGSPANVHYVQDRHSVENLAFDPLILGAFLIRERVVEPAELQLPNALRHFDLNAMHAQNIANALTDKLGFVGATTPCTYIGDFSCDIADPFLSLRGHDLEEQITERFPKLRSYKTGLKRIVIQRAAMDVPHFVPRSLLALFEEILAQDEM